MSITYVVFGGDKGFWSAGGTFTSDWRTAKNFTEAEAVAFCKARSNSRVPDMIGFVPVEKRLLEEVFA